MKQHAGGSGTHTLRHQIAWHQLPPKPACHREPQRHRWVQVGAADVSEGLDHRQHHQPEGQGNARVADSPVGNFVNRDRPCPREYQKKGADDLRKVWWSHGKES